MKPTRRRVLSSGAGLIGAAMIAKKGVAQATLPQAPVSINVIDVAGNLALTQKPIENYRAANPKLVSRFAFTKAPSPELPGKLKAQQSAGRVEIDLVLTGTDALAAGIDQGLWVDLIGQYAAKLPDLKEILEPAAWNLQGLTKGQGVIVCYYPSGPLLQYMPGKVKSVPTTAEELLAWVKANPNRFLYARPANSGPGRTWIMGLPYLLGDTDPKDPVRGWDKTWAYLKELDRHIEYYPAGTGAVMKELGDGSRDMTVTTTGWDINPRVLGVVPKESKIQALKGFHWVSDAQYMCVPKGVSEGKLAVLLDLMNHLLTKEQQAYTFDEGYLYPGPAVKGVTLDMAPKESQDAIREFGRPEYGRLIADNPIELPLEPERMVVAFRIWDEQVAGARRR